MNLEDIMKKMKLFALCMASVLALSAALTGCGNGGSSSKPAGSSSDGSGSSTHNFFHFSFFHVSSLPN